MPFCVDPCRGGRKPAAQEIATPQRPRTMAPYILQARKVDWLLGAMEKKHLDTLMSVETFMKKHACSLFCRLPMLPAYYRDYAGVLEREKPGNYREQLARLEGEPQTNPGPTLEQLHRRGIYITDITPKRGPSSWCPSPDGKWERKG